jgi:hypothetical protein
VMLDDYATPEELVRSVRRYSATATQAFQARHGWVEVR